MSIYYLARLNLVDQVERSIYLKIYWGVGKNKHFGNESDHDSFFVVKVSLRTAVYNMHPCTIW